MIDPEEYKLKHNIQHRIKEYPPMDLSDMVTPIPQPEKPVRKSKPKPVSPEVLGRQMDEAISRAKMTSLKEESKPHTIEPIQRVKRELTHIELEEKTKTISTFLKSPYNNQREEN